MVKRILNVLQKEIRGLHEAAYLLAVFAVLSQVLALVRDRLLASHFGAGETLDIYYAAFRIPDFIFITIASVVSLSVLIPFLVDRINQSKEAGAKLISGVFTYYMMAMVIVTAIVWYFTPNLLGVLFQGFDEQAFTELTTITRILLLQPILLGLSSLFASVVHVYRKFILYAISPLLYNAGIIVGVLYFYDYFGVAGLAYGVVLGALLHLLIQVPFIVQAGFTPRLEFRKHVKEIREIITLSLPRTLALSSNQIAILVLLGLASVMGIGAISVFSLALNLQSVPLVIIGASYSVAAFPTLARLYSNGNKETFFEHITVATRHIIFWSFPAIAAFIVLRAQIVRVIFGSGEFTWTDTRLTAAALATFAVSLVAQSLVLLFVRGYYAAGRTVTPVLINVGSSMLIIVFALLFTRVFESHEMSKYFLEALLRVEGIEGTVVLVLPLAYALATIINAGLFWCFFQKDFEQFPHSLSKTFFQSLSASVVFGFAAHQMLNLLDGVFDIDTFLGIFGQGFISGIVGIIIWFSVLKTLGSKELDEAQKALHRKIWKAEVISSE